MTIDPTRDAAMKAIRESFSDPGHVARYAEGPRRFVPGFADLHRMTAQLLAECVPDDAHILVLGAGGGLELKALAEAHPGWTFVGVDPAPAMLDLARQTLGDAVSRVTLVEGYIDAAPQGPFDGAVCLLTLHFLDAAERIRTEADIHRRLKPGAPFVAAHSSFPQGDARPLWLSRYTGYALGSGADPEIVEKMRAGIEGALCLYDPARDEEMLRAAGFHDVQMFYAAFTWRGWVAYA
jgi:tRNA (cmo5U34)-methyltransferase